MRIYSVLVMGILLLSIFGCHSSTTDVGDSVYKNDTCLIDKNTTQIDTVGLHYLGLYAVPFSLQRRDGFGWVTWIEVKVDGKIRSEASMYHFMKGSPPYENKHDLCLVFRTYADSKRGSVYLGHLQEPSSPSSNMSSLQVIDPAPWASSGSGSSSGSLDYPVITQPNIPVCIRKWNDSISKKGQWDASLWCLFLPTSDFRSITGGGYFSGYSDDSWDFLDSDAVKIVRETMENEN